MDPARELMTKSFAFVISILYLISLLGTGSGNAGIIQKYEPFIA